MTESVTLATIKEVPLAAAGARLEHDLLGELDVPEAAYWGVHTLRAVENFPITGVPIGHFPELVSALAMVKQAAARANVRSATCRATKAEAIERACDAIIAGQYTTNSWSTRSRAAPAPRPT